MCVAIPSRIIEINDLMATIEVYGAERRVSLLLLPEEAEVGDYVLVHAGYAIQKIDAEAGRESLELFSQLIAKMSAADDA